MNEYNENASNIDFSNWVLACHEKNKDAILYMLMKFKPLIKKYSYLLNYSDAEQDIILAFIEVIEKIPVENIKNKNANIFILSYIKTSIKNRYIYLSKHNTYAYSYKEPIYEDNISYKSFSPENVDDNILSSTGLERLTELQKQVILLKYFYGYSDIEISKKFKITRQSVNKIKNRAIGILRYFITDHHK